MIVEYFQLVKLGIFQKSISISLLFLVCINDLPNYSSLLDPIMPADDIKLFYTHTNTRQLFTSVNIPFVLPNLNVNEKVVARENSIKFPGILLEHFLWNEHAKCI